jgi:Amt family ammonium transporter
MAHTMINAGDTAWVLVSTALVMLMTPGLAFFYGGLVRRKNILGVLMQCFIALCVVSIQWILFGFSLAFGPSHGFWGGFAYAGLRGVGFAPNPAYAPTIPFELFMAFQMMFAVITPALIIGAFAERMKFPSFLLFTVLWSTFVYDPIAHWVWGTGGWLKMLGVLDFAGGTVVHINAGIAALVTALIIGKRTIDRTPPPHNLPFAALGAALLWFGWFGFNAGSALAANGIAVNAFVTTNTATAAAGLGWMFMDWIFNEKATLLGVISGAVAGLVAITPASGFVSPMASIIIGFVAGTFCFLAVSFLKPKFGYDDSLDAFGVHGIGGIVGAISTGFFASILINPGGANGLLYGNGKQVLIQLLAVGVTIVYTFISTFIIYKVIDIVMGVRVSEKHEHMGIDLSQHHESAYTLME